MSGPYKEIRRVLQALHTHSGRMMWVSKANRTPWVMFQLIWVDK